MTTITALHKKKTPQEIAEEFTKIIEKRIKELEAIASSPSNTDFYKHSLDMLEVNIVFLNKLGKKYARQVH